MNDASDILVIQTNDTGEFVVKILESHILALRARTPRTTTAQTTTNLESGETSLFTFQHCTDSIENVSISRDIS